MSYVATSATVTKDGTVVTINTGDDVSTIEDKSLLAFNGQTIVTIVKAYTDSSGNQFIQLAMPWPYATQTNKPLIVVPMSANFVAATAELRRVIDTLQVASTVEARAGTDNEKIMTALKTKQAISAQTGTAATKDVTTSSTDTTAGRVLKVGDFGIGGGGSLGIPFAIGSQSNAGGFYRTIGTTAGNFPSASTRFGYATVEKYDATNILESWTPVSANRFFKRTISGDVERSWVEMYHSGNTGTAATKDVITSQSDRTEGRVLTTGAGGVLGKSPTIANANDAPLGVFGVLGTVTHAEAVAAGLPDLDLSDTSPCWWNLQTYGVSNRRTQIATQIFAVGNHQNATYTRVKQDSTWSEWTINYTSSNLDAYSVGGNDGAILATGQALNNEIKIMIPAVLSSSPTSISVTGSFSFIQGVSDTNLEEGITAINYVARRSSRSMIYLTVPVSFSPTNGSMYILKSNSSDAKIRFNV